MQVRRPTDVKSFDQYRKRVCTLVTEAPVAVRMEFCAWILKRLPEAFGASVWKGLTAAELGRFHAMLQAVESAAAEGKPLSPPQAAALQAELMAFGPEDDEGAKIEVDPDATEFQGALWTALEFCRTGDVSRVCVMSEYPINCWDYRLEPVHETYTLENMFTFPEMRQEFELHEHMLQRR